MKHKKVYYSGIYITETTQKLKEFDETQPEKQPAKLKEAHAKLMEALHKEFDKQ